MQKFLPLAILIASLSFAGAQPEVVPAGSSQNNGGGGISRENIEWLDVWLPNSNDHDLPRVLLIGDSITRAYNKPVEALLKGKAYTSRFATSKSLGDPAYLLEVALILQEQTPDIIHFNNGMHGDGYTEAQYAADLPKLVALFHQYAPNAKLIAATTTDVRDKTNLQKVAPKTDHMIARNKILTDYCAQNSIPVDDLFSLVKDHPEYHAKDGVHFAPAGVEVEAKQVAEKITALLPN